MTNKKKESKPVPVVVVNLPYRPQGELIEVVDLGGFPNGGEYEVSEEKWNAFVAGRGARFAGSRRAVFGEALTPKNTEKE